LIGEFIWRKVRRFTGGVHQGSGEAVRGLGLDDVA
jgi:hypothetical protein